MIPNCPNCSHPGENHPARDRAVRYCPNCNLVFDGLEIHPYRGPRPASDLERMDADGWEYAVEQAKAELERSAARLKNKGRRRRWLR